MAALTRESSFERLLSKMDSRSANSINYETMASQNEASHVISSWLKKKLKLKAVYKSMRSADLLVIEGALESLSNLESRAFENGQEIVSAEVFVHALSNFLNLLPSDPGLKKKNKMARSVRIVGSALLIAKFPGLVLEADGQPDAGKEARECHQVAEVFMMSLKRLARILQRPATSLNAFRNVLIGYRFSLRHFLTAIEAWKQIDKDRLKHSFEVAYCESYMVIWTSEKMFEKLTEELATCSEDDRSALLRQRDENKAFIESGRTRLTQFRDMLGKLLGPRESKDLLEELDAYLLSSTQAMDVHLLQEGEASHESPLPTPTAHGSAEVSNAGFLSATPQSSAAASTSTTSPPQPPSSPELLKLRRVSTMTGLGENKILHELSLNAKFQLPDPLPPLRAFDSEVDGYVPNASALTESALMELMQTDPLRGKEVLKKIMIRTIEDRFVANMKQSPLHAVSEVQVGKVYPVWYGSESPTRQGETPSGVFMNAQILSINLDGGRMDCKYIADGIVESDIPLNRVKLSSQARDPVGSGFLSFLQDITGRMAGMIPSRSDMHAELSSAVDLALLQQMVVNNALSVNDLVNLASTLVSFITKLQSPHRSSEFIQWFNPLARHLHSLANLDDALIYIPKFFEVVSERLDQMQVEIANFYLGQLAPYAQAEGPGIFKEIVRAKIQEMEQKESVRNGGGGGIVTVMDEHYAKHLPRTTSFLCTQLQESQALLSIVSYLKELQVIPPDEEHTELQSLGIGSATERGKRIDKALMARAFSQLLQENIDLGSSEGGRLLLETFVWDGERLRNLKNEIDSLVLVTTLLISCRSYLLSVKKRLSQEQEVALQDMLFEVLRDPSVSLVGVVTTAQNFVRKNVGLGEGENTSSVGSGTLPAGWESVLEEALKKCILSTSPVFMLFSKRVHSVLVKALVDAPFTDLLGRFSMNSRPQIQQLKVIISAAKGLFVHNSKAFGGVYSSIMRVHCRNVHT